MTKATPLMGAASQGYASTVALLLARGARIDVRYDRPEPDDRDWTALLLAIRNQRPEVVRALLAKGADVETFNSNGDNGLLLARAARPRRHDAGGADEGDRPRRARPLGPHTADCCSSKHAVAGNGGDRAVRCADRDARARGARVDPHDKDGTTALMLAAQSGSPASVKLLLDHGARAAVRDAKGRRAVDYLDRDGDPKRTAEIVRLLARSA